MFVVKNLKLNCNQKKLIFTILSIFDRKNTFLYSKNTFLKKVKSSFDHLCGHRSCSNFNSKRLRYGAFFPQIFSLLANVKVVVTGHLLITHTPKIHVSKKCDPVITPFPAADHAQILTVESSGIEDYSLKFSAT